MASGRQSTSCRPPLQSPRDIGWLAEEVNGAKLVHRSLSERNSTAPSAPCFFVEDAIGSHKSVGGGGRWNGQQVLGQGRWRVRIYEPQTCQGQLAQGQPCASPVGVLMLPGLHWVGPNKEWP